MTTSLHQRIRRGLILLPLLLLTPAASALDLQQAKAQSLVGETPSGYLAAVKPGAEVNALIQDINSRRKAEYQRIAQTNNTPLETVEKLAGKKAIDRTPAGQFVQIGGNWIKK